MLLKFSLTLSLKSYMLAAENSFPRVRLAESVAHRTCSYLSNFRAVVSVQALLSQEINRLLVVTVEVSAKATSSERSCRRETDGQFMAKAE